MTPFKKIGCSDKKTLKRKDSLKQTVFKKNRNPLNRPLKKDRNPLKYCGPFEKNRNLKKAFKKR